MTQEQKVRILELRNQGKGYGEIAKELNMDKSTVHKFIIRNVNNDSSICKYCGNKIIQNKSYKRRVFCSKTCRENWWNRNRDKLKSKDKYKFKCQGCGLEFISFKHVNQKYCSRQCYFENRFKGGEANE